MRIYIQNKQLVFIPEDGEGKERDEQDIKYLLKLEGTYPNGTYCQWDLNTIADYRHSAEKEFILPAAIKIRMDLKDDVPQHILIFPKDRESQAPIQFLIKYVREQYKVRKTYDYASRYYWPGRFLKKLFGCRTKPTAPLRLNVQSLKKKEDPHDVPSNQTESSP